MTYRWKKNLEAVQLPGDLSGVGEGGGLNAKKGDWIVFEEGKYVGCFNDKQWRERAEMVPPLRKQRRGKPNPEDLPAANGETPRRRGPGRKALGRSPLQDGQPTTGLPA